MVGFEANEEATVGSWLLRPLLDSLVREARLERGVPGCVAEDARRVAGARFAGMVASGSLDSQARRRVIAYFWGVVRRRAIRHAPEYARRIVRATVAADLIGAGWDVADIEAELDRSALLRHATARGSDLLH